MGGEHVHEFPGKFRVKLSAGMGQDFFQGIGNAATVAIRTVGGQGVIDIRQGQEAATEGDFLPRQALGLPPAIPTLVVIEDDAFFLGPQSQGLHNLAADQGMGFDDQSFVRSQRAGL